MQEVVTLRLETEMDILLANRRTMKLAELCGQSLTAQTVVATAVSEIARAALSIDHNALLKLGITSLPLRRKKFTAILCNTVAECVNSEAFHFAKRLVSDIQVINGKGRSCDIQMELEIKNGALITESKVASFIDYFRTEPPLSPYDELRRKSMQLLEFSRKLEESEGQYRQLADTLPLMMFVANPAGEVIYTNRWLQDHLGNSLVTIAPSALQPNTHPEDQAALTRGWHAAFGNGRAFSAEARLHSKKINSYVWHLVSILPVRNEINAIIQWTGFLVDIHAQKTVEAALRDNAELISARESMVDYQRQLEAKIIELNTSNNDLEQFAYIASHDLQEPLRKIATFSTLLQANLHDLDSESQVYFSRIISSSVQMTSQINDVLEWSSLTKSGDTFLPVDLNSIMESVTSDLEVLIKERGAVIQSSDLPVVVGSRLQLIRFFTNLVGNAIKFSPDTPVVKISSRAMDQVEAGRRKKLDSSRRYVEVSVSDNGVGFKQEYAEQIFRIFQRLHGHHEYKGTGIGLAICSRIADNHHGEVYATSRPGLGATFTAILPVARQE